MKRLTDILGLIKMDRPFARHALVAIVAAGTCGSTDFPNKTPIATADTYSTLTGQVLSVSAPGVLANDVSVVGNHTLIAAEDSGPSHGSLTLNTDGSFTYTPNAGYFGADSFSYHALDNNVPSTTVTVSLNVSRHWADLSWQASSSPVVGYNVYRGTVSGGPYEPLGATSGDTTFRDMTVQAGTTYYYVTTAEAATGLESTLSSEVSVVIPAP